MLNYKLLACPFLILLLYQSHEFDPSAHLQRTAFKLRKEKNALPSHSPHRAPCGAKAFSGLGFPNVLLSQTRVSTEQKSLLRRPCLKSYLFLGRGTPCRGFKTWCYSQTLVQLEVGAHSGFLIAQLEDVTPGLSTWLRTRDLAHIHRRIGFTPLLTTKVFELILLKSL